PADAPFARRHQSRAGRRLQRRMNVTERDAARAINQEPVGGETELAAQRAGDIDIVLDDGVAGKSALARDVAAFGVAFETENEPVPLEIVAAMDAAEAARRARAIGESPANAGGVAAGRAPAIAALHADFGAVPLLRKSRRRQGKASRRGRYQKSLHNRCSEGHSGSCDAPRRLYGALSRKTWVGGYRR